MSVYSFANGSPRQSKVVKFPALIKSNQKPLEWWAQGGLVWCSDPNKKDGKPVSAFPTEALMRVRSVIIPFLRAMKNHPNDYHVQVTVLKDFFNRFVSDVHDEALRQDEAVGDPVRSLCHQYGQGKAEAIKQRQLQLAEEQKKQKSSASGVFTVSREALKSSRTRR
jgi:hypothetical protein